MKQEKIITDVASYYSEKLAIHGETPRGVDWNGEESQNIRFEQLSKIIRKDSPFSVNDIGCGYGALQEYLTAKYQHFSYSGYDISKAMIEAAKARFINVSGISFHNTGEPSQKADYSVASGIFNVRLDVTEERWWNYVETLLDILDRSSQAGFSFNCLTRYSDEEKMRDNLFYPDPGRIFDLCKTKFSRNVALLHDYDLYEFTILVRKQ